MDLSSGSFSGTYQASGSSGTISGSENGGAATFRYTASSPESYYTENYAGQINADGSMSGTWTDNCRCGAQSGTWSASRTTGLVSWWKADGNANDSIGTNNGTLVGGVYAPGQNGQQAFSFDGQDDYVSVPKNPSLEPSSAISVSAWIKSTGPGIETYVVSKGASGCSNASYALYSSGSGGLEFYVDTPSGYVLSPDAGTGIWDGAWHYVVGAYNGAAVTLSVDGTQVGSPTPASGGIGYNLPTHNNLFIGAYDPTGCGRFFSGEIQDVTLYNRDVSGGGGGPDAPLRWISDPSGSVTAGPDRYASVIMFTDTDPFPNPSDLSVDINWGDGHTTTGIRVRPFTDFGLGPLVTRGGSVVNAFVANASHTYTYKQVTRIATKFSVHDVGGSSLSATATYVDVPKAFVLMQQQQKQAALNQMLKDYANMDAACKVFVASKPFFLAPLLAQKIVQYFGQKDCWDTVVDFFSQRQKAYDPPSKDYRKVVRPRGIKPVARSRVRCKGSHRLACSGLLKGVNAYLTARASEASLDEATAITQNRYTGALIARDHRAAKRQKTAFKRYMKQLAMAIMRRRQAGRALANELRRDGIKIVLTGSQLSQAISDVLALHDIPSGAIQRVLHDGLAASTSDLQLQLAAVAITRPPPTSISIAAILSR